MPLESQSGTRYLAIPLKREKEHAAELAALDARFPGAKAAIRDALNRYVDDWLLQHQNEPSAAFCSSWVPGPDWNDGSGVYQPIFDTMAEVYVDTAFAHKRAGWFFGLILMRVMIDRLDYWTCWHLPSDRNEDPLGMFYRRRA